MELMQSIIALYIDVMLREGRARGGSEPNVTMMLSIQKISLERDASVKVSLQCSLTFQDFIQ